MHICFTLSSLSHGGAERVASTLSNFFASQGHKVSIILVSIDHNNNVFDLDERVDVIPLLTCQKDKKPIRRIKLLKRKVLEIRPDIVIAFLPHVCVYTYYALKHTDIPFICSERNDPNKYSRFYKFLLKKAFKHADGCVFQTEDCRNFYKKVSKSKAIIIRNPVNLSAKPNPTYSSNKEKTFISVGRLAPQKNFSFLITSFSKFYQTHQDYKLVIYGEGPLRPDLEKQIKSLGMDNAILLPGTSNKWHSEVVKSSGFISTSNYEGMPNCLEEALCLGCPCIATDCPIGGSKDLINLLNNGILIKMNDENALLNAMDAIAKGNYIIHPFDSSSLSIRRIGETWISFIDKIIVS